MTAVAVATGAAGAMGSACIRALAPSVDIVVLTDIDGGRLDVVADELRAETVAKVVTVVADLADPECARELARRVGALGDFRALVHTAGLSPAMAGWREILGVDLVATADLLDCFTPLVRRGSVAVCIASVSGRMGEFDAAMDTVLAGPYDASFETRFEQQFGSDPDSGSTYRLAKRGVIRACERAAVTWGAQGGRVLSLSPGLIDTAMGRLELEHQPIKQWLAEMTPVRSAQRGSDSLLPGQIVDIADVVEFLCSDRAAFVSGCDILVDGGLLAALAHQP